MKIFTLAGAIFSALWGLPAAADILVQWNMADGGNGHWYQLVEEDVEDAGSFAVVNESANAMSHLGVSGHLVTIANQAEQDFIYDSFKDGGTPGLTYRPWIGLTDNEAYGGEESHVWTNSGAPYWVWVTGEPVTYVNWLTTDSGWSVNEPNDIGGNEDVVEMVLRYPRAEPGGWNDVEGTSAGLFLRHYIVEYDTVPEPSSLVLAVFAMLAGATWLRRR